VEGDAGFVGIRGRADFELVELRVRGGNADDFFVLGSRRRPTEASRARASATDGVAGHVVHGRAGSHGRAAAPPSFLSLGLLARLPFISSRRKTILARRGGSTGCRFELPWLAVASPCIGVTSRLPGRHAPVPGGYAFLRCATHEGAGSAKNDAGSAHSS